MKKILRGKYESISRSYSRELADLIHICLTKDPVKRPAITDIIRIPYLQKKANLFKIAIPKELRNRLDPIEAALKEEDKSMIHPAITAARRHSYNPAQVLKRQVQTKGTDSPLLRRLSYWNRVKQSLIPK